MLCQSISKILLCTCDSGSFSLRVSKAQTRNKLFRFPRQRHSAVLPYIIEASAVKSNGTICHENVVSSYAQ